LPGSLKDDSITIRKIRGSDAEGIYAAVRESIDELYPWTDWAHEHYSYVEAKEWADFGARLWKRGREYHFVIEDNSTRDILGGCGLGRLDRRNRVGEVGYWVRSGRTGQGIATAAVRLCAKFAFEELGLMRLEFIIDVRNRASCRVVEKSGAEREGILSRRLWMHGSQRDAVSYSITRRDSAV